MFIVLNVPQREKGIESVKNKVSKDLAKQGYEFEERLELGNVLAIIIRDRKKEQPSPQSSEDLANRYVLDEIKHKGLPQVILRRQAAIEASMGANIVSGDISGIPTLVQGDEAILMDMHYNIVGHGISGMSSEEIRRSPGRIAVRTIEGRYDVPKFHETKHYRNGLYSQTTLPRLLGMNMLKFTKDPALILVICQDDGEVCVELLNRAPPSSKVFFITRNENHRKAITSTFERLQIDEGRIELVGMTLDRYSKSRPREKFTHVYLEMPSTETGKRPNPYFDGEEKLVISNARAQFSALRSIALITGTEASITYVTHSIDPSENQEVIVQAFRQGNFKSVDLGEELLSKYPLPMNALPEIPTVTQTGNLALSKFKSEMIYAKSWLKIDPIENDSDAGFVARLELNI